MTYAQKGVQGFVIPPPMDRLINRITLDENGCWLVGRSGHYAQIMIQGKNQGAHRFTYKHFRGEIAEGLTIDHLCRVQNCVNPWHLEPVPIRVNVLRGETNPAENLAKTHCIHGHEFTPENTYVDKRGWRHCRACHRRRFHERKAALRAEVERHA